MKKILNTALFASFLLTVLVPLTGLHIHKLASVLFLLLSVIHAVVYRRKLGIKRYLLLGLIAAAFVTGLLGMIFDQYAIILALHRVISMAVIFFLAIHIFVFHRRMPAAGRNR